jgi:hypothetical protein
MLICRCLSLLRQKDEHEVLLLQAVEQAKQQVANNLMGDVESVTLKMKLEYESSQATAIIEERRRAQIEL